jgi:hypothetical protein
VTLLLRGMRDQARIEGLNPDIWASATLVVMFECAGWTPDAHRDGNTVRTARRHHPAGERRVAGGARLTVEVAN